MRPASNLLNIIRLYNQIEYTAVNITLKTDTIAEKWLFSNKPSNIKNSPIKLLVPGKLILDNISIKKQKLNNGIVNTSPL